MLQPNLLPSDQKEQPLLGLIDLNGYKPFYVLLRALVAVQEEGTFFERLQIILMLAQWQGDPPTIHTLTRRLNTTQNDLAPNLNTLRSAGWLETEDGRRYRLSPRGRILIVLLQLLAQPWEEGDAALVASQMYQAAEGLDLRRDLLKAQFETVLSTMDERIRLFEGILGVEDTQQISNALRESHRDVQIARKALDLRERGATLPDEYNQIQRMHQTISRLMQMTSELDLRYQRLIARDLLARGLVSLGDILEWAKDASEGDRADALQPFLKTTFLPLWATPDRLLLDRGIELSGKVIDRPKMVLPQPIPLVHLPAESNMDEIKQAIFRKQIELREKLKQNDPISLTRWVDQKDWVESVLHFLSAIDPELHKNEPPVYLNLDPSGKLDSELQHAASLVTSGRLTKRRSI